MVSTILTPAGDTAPLHRRLYRHLSDLKSNSYAYSNGNCYCGINTNPEDHSRVKATPDSGT